MVVVFELLWFNVVIFLVFWLIFWNLVIKMICFFLRVVCSCFGVMLMILVLLWVLVVIILVCELVNDWVCVLSDLMVMVINVFEMCLLVVSSMFSF